jgi:hypothetical protein
VPSFDPTNATCRVFTEKDGLLARLAHDLELDVTEFTIRAEGGVVEATFNPRSLKVLHALHGGKPTDALSHWDTRDIEGNIVEQVLTSPAPIHFVSTSLVRAGDGGKLGGTLTLNARSRPIELEVRREDGRFVTELVIHQLDWGILPYEAMMGAVKIKPHVRVRITVPAWD